ncbi:type VI secretion system membrane subunit TssM [Sphingomonas sp. PR090111-T3T-6A]|uniref:type VI secretion system membrane subunit TssM n=1 Tax=Sphingomonas sp. PR090111-T3T-6A TaxID=685778 RepID=UPI000363D451|nr:type VI secretion system membrane subunit TssM [Sphingomonas sp. PR090111-T3T-6A]
MEKLMRGWWALAGTAALILTLLASIGLPTLFPVLRATWIRMLLIGLVALSLAAAAGWRWWRGRKAADSLAAELAEPTPEETEGALLSGRMRDALAQLKETVNGRRDYLYAKPWYLIIGPPGAGKTTALLNSGVRFPWSDSALKGVGGTRNLDFWFADEAVLVDTAGRYTTQDSDAAADAAGWEKFLRLLRRARPLQPVNGILVTLGVDELMSATREGVDAHAAAVRRRLAELRRVLGVTAPVYMLFPKTDLLAGFDEYFADLSAEGRRAVLGASLPLGKAADAAAVIAEFDQMIEAVWERSAKRLQDEPDQRRRSLILSFPAQLASLRARFARFVEGACPPEGEGGHMLRGFYFASGVQEGAPLDRVLSAMAAVYEEEQTPARGGSRGKAYFLNRLLTEVVFPEAGLVRAELAIRRRRRIVMGAALGAMALAGLAMAGLWVNSFAHNKALQSALLASGQQAIGQEQASGIDLVEVRESDPDLEQALPLLDRLRTMPRGFADQQAGGPPWSMRLGLFQAGHADAARQAYLEALQRVMLPRILLRLEQTMRQDADQPIKLYEPLKTYLMLGGYGPLDAAAVRAWVVEDWRTQSLAGSDRAEVRTRLGKHLDVLLADPDIGRVWPGRRAPLDGALIASTRAAVQTLSVADRAYAVLRQRAAATGKPDWRGDSILAAGDAQAFANGPTVLQMSVPWFFTADGYHKAYQPGLLDVEAELGRDLWVLGPDAAKASIRDQLPAMRAAVAQDYARDYIQAWDAVLGTPQPADYFANRAALGAFTRTPSPMKTLLLEARRNTMLGSDGAGGGGFDAGHAIQDHFRGVADFAGQSVSAAAPVDELVKAIRQAAAATTAAGVPGVTLDGGAVQGQLATALGDLSTAGVVAPPQLQPFVAQATRRGRGAATRTALSTLNQQYTANVLPACLSVAQGHYPFVRSARNDVVVADLQRVYGANGQIDGFTRDRLQPLLDTAAPVWRWRGGDPVAQGLSPSSAAQFQKAAAIRDLMSAGLALDVSLASLGHGVDAVEISAGGTTYRLDGKDMASHPLIWTPTGLPHAHIVLLSGRKEVHRDQSDGAWALFHVLDAGQVRNAGASAIQATFGSGDQTASLLIRLPATSNPFGRGGPFSFQCPERL